MQGWFNFRKSITIIHYNNQLKNKDHMIILQVLEKVYKFQHSFQIFKTEKLNKIGIGRYFINMIYTS